MPFLYSHSYECVTPNSDSPEFKKKKKSKINHLADLISNLMCQMVKPELGSRHYLAGAYKQN